MRTSKSISTISYNTESFLKRKLYELYESRKICDFMYIHHKAEEDEAKNHYHVFIQPNTLVDTMVLQSHFKEIDLSNPNKPLGCINFQFSKIDDWILYCQHYEPYLRSKMQSRKYRYKKTDFFYVDDDTFEFNYNHAMVGSDWALRNQLLNTLSDGSVPAYKLILNGTLPLNMSSQLNSFMHLQHIYSTDEVHRGNGKNHDTDGNNPFVNK